MNVTAESDRSAQVEDQTVVHVEPVAGGWRLRCEPCGEPLMFLSARQAELHGRALGRRLAGLGLDAWVKVHDASRAVVAEFHYDPVGA